MGNYKSTTAFELADQIRQAIGFAEIYPKDIYSSNALLLVNKLEDELRELDKIINELIPYEVLQKLRSGDFGKIENEE